MKRERHHRHPKSRAALYSKPINSEENISLVRREYHSAYHLLFGNMVPEEMAKLLNDVWISPDYYLVAFKKKKKPPRFRRKRRYCLDCSAEVLKLLPTTGKEE